MRLAVVLVVSIAACRAPRPIVPSEDVRIGRVEDHLLPRVVPEGRVGGRPIGERMARYRVPGASVAVLDEGRVVWARGYGVGTAETEASDLARAVAAAGRGPAGPGLTVEGSGAARRWRGSRDSRSSRATVLYYPDRGQGAVVMTQRRRR